MSVTIHTDLGDLKLEVFCEECPKTAQNFLALCASGYYDECIFHRVIKGFMVQTGDPTGTGKGGNSIWGKKFEDEIREDLRHNRRGTLAMANNGPNTNGSQFYIACAPQPHLDLKYTVFGRMLDGEDTLSAIEKLQVDTKYHPHKQCKITGVTIHANPLAG
ncbi:peptidyl-prolyl cis-trans isomerase-like 3 [Paramacrobiotus metropolitanus]|uniref:peptidyl-prolyl cis-trans isomerase-like 3 n=1 Tax=Paramacrobiotus metropolitanus TaxID=2943436 RepID=UPI002445EA50|nr:peptidyl-prolyl cis-trans isomerase-like 3 [Paramacrobiotus metropolitanus]XP_055334641.1 peptidyl-prolyl cis-trans isomerase-like 3 [Paramacrobiotus metropolitanus]